MGCDCGPGESCGTPSAKKTDENHTQTKLRQYIITTPYGQPQTQLYVVDNLLRMGEAAKDIVDLALPQG